MQQPRHSSTRSATHPPAPARFGLAHAAPVGGCGPLPGGGEAMLIPVEGHAQLPQSLDAMGCLAPEAVRHPRRKGRLRPERCPLHGCRRCPPCGSQQQCRPEPSGWRSAACVAVEQQHRELRGRSRRVIKPAATAPTTTTSRDLKGWDQSCGAGPSRDKKTAGCPAVQTVTVNVTGLAISGTDRHDAVITSLRAMEGGVTVRYRGTWQQLLLALAQVQRERPQHCRRDHPKRSFQPWSGTCPGIAGSDTRRNCSGQPCLLVQRSCHQQRCGSRAGILVAQVVFGVNAAGKHKACHQLAITRRRSASSEAASSQLSISGSERVDRHCRLGKTTSRCAFRVPESELLQFVSLDQATEPGLQQCRKQK